MIDNFTNDLSYQYAFALYSLQETMEDKQVTYDNLLVIQDIFSNDEVQKILNHPLMGQNEKKEIFKHTLENKVSPEFLYFIYVLIDNNRLNKDTIDYILNSYLDLLDNDSGILRIKIESKVKLQDYQLEKIGNLLKQKYNRKKIELTMDINEEIIGGVTIRVYNDVMKGTVDDLLYQVKSSIK